MGQWIAYVLSAAYVLHEQLCFRGKKYDHGQKSRRSIRLCTKIRLYTLHVQTRFAMK